MKIALIGLGAIGVPIAHKLYQKYKESFILIADEDRKNNLCGRDIYINGDVFKPLIVSENDHQEVGCVDVLLVCVKNYALNSILRNIAPYIDKKTIILPLQNGIFAFDFFRDHFPDNTILRGYVQGPNTEIVNEGFKYENPGDLHVGSENKSEVANSVVTVLSKAGIPAYYEENIVKMVWKKWMLNVAGNSITALTGADYSLFKLYSDLQNLCRKAMGEFVSIASAEGVTLNEKDIEDIIQYYVTYIGGKKTSMLMDVLNERKTENDYLAGTALQLAKKHNLDVPIISTLYYLLEVKEEVYMERKGCRTTELYTEGVEYSDALRVQMNDLDRKMKSAEYADVITRGASPEALTNMLQYAVKNSSYYSSYQEFNCLQDFPVMNKEKLNVHYDEIAVHSFDNSKTHKMYTSGSTGIPFAVIQNLAKRERNIADLKYYGTLAGYSDHDPMCYLRAKPALSQVQQEKDNIWQVDASSLSGRNLTDYFHLVVEKKCTALIGYASTLEIAVSYWADHFENETSIKTIISTSEELTEITRKKLKDFFGNNVRIVARYSNAEQGILGQEDGINGEYVLNWASFYFEVLKLNSDDPAATGEIGRIIITDLYNKAFPMIRYDTGDTGRIVNRKGKLPVLSELSGRQMDVIYDVNGDPVSPFLISRTLRYSDGIKQWQFIQVGESSYVLKIIHDQSNIPNLDAEVEELKRTLGYKAEIRKEYVNDGTVNNSVDWKLIISHISK